MLLTYIWVSHKELENKRKINIAKIRIDSHELYSESGCWTISKTPKHSGMKESVIFVTLRGLKMKNTSS
jgi:hypothetical protein